MAGAITAQTISLCRSSDKQAIEAETGVIISNWSATHNASPKEYYSPDSVSAVDQVIQAMHAAGKRIRVIGSALSPNGLGLSDESMLGMALCDEVIHVDVAKKQVTVQAGARVKEVVEALRPHGLTLQNYASIAEQQIGGFLQVGAHGTGAAVPPVDEQVIRMKLHTPALGALELSLENNPKLFKLARVGLGALGVVSEVTIQCVEAHKLVQHTFTDTRAGVMSRHQHNLAHKHMRYMWIPYTDTVVVVTCDPVEEGAPPPSAPVDELRATEPMRELLLQKSPQTSASEASEMNFAQLRDALLALAPLDADHVRAVNKAEAAFWKRSEGYRVDWSDKILGFDCGGQQWVSEVVMPCGTVAESDGRELKYMLELLDLIEQKQLPAPAPIEQRWTSSSSSPMSPAHSPSPDDLHSWVGIIMYLPEEEVQREAITKTFWEYNAMCRDNLWSKYGAHQHWAKIELPESESERAWVKRRLRERFPIDEMRKAQAKLDPKHILVNPLVDEILREE